MTSSHSPTPSSWPISAFSASGVSTTRMGFLRECGRSVGRGGAAINPASGARAPALPSRMAIAPRQSRLRPAIVTAQVLTQIGAFTLPALLPGYIDAGR